MHTEAEIRRAIRPLVERYGQLTTTEVKKLLDTVITFDSDDLRISPTRRGETMIMQRIGNIASHQTSVVKIYPEGFMVDKSSRPAKFTAITGIKGNVMPLSNTVINKRRQNIKRKRRIIPKVDWDEVDTIRKLIGDAGEDFVVQREKDKVKNIDKDAVDRVIRVSQKQEGDGYDILSLDKYGKTIYIEVKTTTKGADTAFYITENERLFLEEHKDIDDAFIYRVYNFDIDTRFGQVKIIKAKDFFKKYNIDPVTYKVTKK